MACLPFVLISSFLWCMLTRWLDILFLVFDQAFTHSTSRFCREKKKAFNKVELWVYMWTHYQGTSFLCKCIIQEQKALRISEFLLWIVFECIGIFFIFLLAFDLKQLCSPVPWHLLLLPLCHHPCSSCRWAG